MQYVPHLSIFNLSSVSLIRGTHIFSYTNFLYLYLIPFHLTFYELI